MALPDPWWTLFDDPVLTRLVARAAEDNLDIRIATARVLQSRAERRIAGGGSYPAIAAQGSYQRVRASSGSASPPPPAAQGNSFDVGRSALDASWEIDLWGRVGRNVEAADARAQASEDDRRLVLLSVEADIASGYVELRGTQAQLDILTENLAIAHDSVRLTRLRFANGATTRLDVANAQAEVDAIAAVMPRVEAREKHLANALSLLLGLMPHALEAELRSTGRLPPLPPVVPIGLPSDLLQRRPDVRAAEAQLHAATAEIGVAKADFYPRIALTANVASEAVQLSNFGSWSSRQFSIGPLLSLPIFTGGRLAGVLLLRKAEQQQAAIRYQAVVLDAWNEVDNALSEHEAEQTRLASLTDQVAQNVVALAIAQHRYREGAIDFLNVLNVQRQLLGARTDLIESKVAANRNVIKLYKAMGGGWQARFPIDPAPRAQTRDGQ